MDFAENSSALYAILLQRPKYGVGSKSPRKAIGAVPIDIQIYRGRWPTICLSGCWREAHEPPPCTFCALWTVSVANVCTLPFDETIPARESVTGSWWGPGRCDNDIDPRCQTKGQFGKCRSERCQLGQLKALSAWKDVSLITPTIARPTNRVVHRHHLIARVTNVTHGTCDTPVPTVGCTYSLRRRKFVSCRGPLETRSGRWRSYRYGEIRIPKYATWGTCDSLFVSTGQPAYAIGRERYARTLSAMTLRFVFIKHQTFVATCPCSATYAFGSRAFSFECLSCLSYWRPPTFRVFWFPTCIPAGSGRWPQ